MSKVRPWRELDTRRLLQCRIFSVDESTAESPTDGSRHSFYRLSCADWVQLIALTALNELVMVRQYRHGSSGITLEVPGGLVESGEDPAQAALRECLEETGYRAERAELLGALNPNPALFPNRISTYWARNAERVANIVQSPTEHTEVVLVPLAELPDALRNGTIDHALVAGALWRFLAEQHVGR
jgi:ADP-ribose pyrophosphatase